MLFGFMGCFSFVDFALWGWLLYGVLLFVYVCCLIGLFGWFWLTWLIGVVWFLCFVLYYYYVIWFGDYLLCHWLLVWIGWMRGLFCGFTNWLKGWLDCCLGFFGFGGLGVCFVGFAWVWLNFGLVFRLVWIVDCGLHLEWVCLLCGLLCILTNREVCVAAFLLLYFMFCLIVLLLIVVSLILWIVYSLIYLFKLLLLLYLLILCFCFVLLGWVGGFGRICFVLVLMGLFLVIS